MPAPASPGAPWTRPFHVMAKPMGARCNLGCKYCFYLEKEPAYYPEAGVPRMRPDTLEAYIRDYLASQPGAEVNFTWQGGEPTLMGLPFFERVVALQQHYAAGRRVTNSLQTNGVLLDDAWGAFLGRHGFLVGISIDGPRAMHDAYRVDNGGRPTWSRVMRGLRTLKRHRVQFNTLTVVHRRNYRHPLEVYEFLRAEGSRFMQFIPLVERRARPADTAARLDHAPPPAGAGDLVAPEAAGAAAAAECAPRDGLGDFLCAIFDQWVRRDVGRVFVQQFDVALSSWCGLGAGLCIFEERCGRALALEHNGDVYACDHFVYPEYRLGNLHATPLADLGNGAAAARFGDAKANLPRVCRECPVRFACNGDCPKHRFVRAGDGEPGVSYLCPSYLRFFTHIDPAMRRMAALVQAGRPAAEIMGSGKP
ncbi:MAG TPA: anaerobic sulfatase maturase [Opitutaceae bacterium]|nr:anaerobic sulfatase maturase [Opitutaceae bacterium]